MQLTFSKVGRNWTDCQNARSASSATWRAMASEEVAAGEGAFRTCSARPVREKTKSSTRLRRARAPGRELRRTTAPHRPAAARAHSGRPRARRRSAGQRGEARSSRCATSARASARCRASRTCRAGRGRAPCEAVGVTSAGDQRRRPDQDLAVDVLASGERRGTAATGRARGRSARARDRGARAAAAGRRRGKARSEGRGLRPRPRPDDRPMRPRRRPHGRPPSCPGRASAAAARAASPRLSTSQPVRDPAPASRTSSRRRGRQRRSRRSRCRANAEPRCPRRVARARAMPAASIRRRPRTPLAVPRRSSSSRRPSSEGRVARSPCRSARCAIPRCVAVVVQLPGALHAQPGLQRAGLVVDARRGSPPSCGPLMGCELVLALEHAYRGPRVAGDQLARDRQTEDPASHDREVAAPGRRNGRIGGGTRSGY